ncbi:hypothetical protein BD410DRAFT_582491 [Rickenella mellea]|uniref:Uncharacterized protein n=1 Tax=Rickenella mellea TaxID=50990 RepID=A0A4Y7PPT9_9AGAM|nr:hypothetical protein BD410DRAFT_582491 [Rickenella mellea]
MASSGCPHQSSMTWSSWSSLRSAQPSSSTSLTNIKPKRFPCESAFTPPAPTVHKHSTLSNQVTPVQNPTQSGSKIQRHDGLSGTRSELSSRSR